jgi:peroxiredoxin-like protein
MHAFPHLYRVESSASPAGNVSIKAEGLGGIESAPPKEFDGPGNLWSPETLLTAAVNDCFMLGFRAIAAASKFQWTALQSKTEGTLDRVDGKMRFTKFVTHAKLQIPAGADAERARKLMEKAEQVCLIANSLSAERHLEAEVSIG